MLHFLDEESLKVKNSYSPAGNQTQDLLISRPVLSHWATDTFWNFNAKVLYLNHCFDASHKTLLKINPWDLPLNSFYLILILFICYTFRTKKVWRSKIVVAWLGIEPTTFRLAGQSSTSELLAHSENWMQKSCTWIIDNVMLNKV